jgi:glyoxylase-like metal-dependent hydrolase (beta-lactamase superfamily II)
MLTRWLLWLFWRPFERFSRWLPIVPLRATVTSPLPGVTKIAISNPVTRAIARLGGYDYSISYVIDGEVLIDTGFPWARRTLKRVFSDLGLDRTLKCVVNTHYHEDHIGNNDLAVEMSGAVIYAGSEALPEIKYPREHAWYRRFLFGPATPIAVEAAPECIHTKARELEIAEFPGHCPGHLCVLDKRRGYFFSGDLFISAELDSQLSDADGPSWIASLERALRLDVAVLLDGHGVVVEGREQVREVLGKKLEFLVELRRRIIAAADRPRTLQSLTAEVFGTDGFLNRLSFSDGRLSLLTGADFSRSNLVRTFLAEAGHGSRRALMQSASR